jgi:AcrR family transcriptional regulator
MNEHSFMPPHVARDKREAILEAALGLFAERTFEGAPVPLVAERAGVAAGTIYRYFDTKEALVNAVYRRWKGQLRDLVRDAMSRPGTARERFACVWRALWRFATDEPRAFTFLETHHHAAYLDAESVKVGAEVDAVATGFVRGAQASGEVREGSPEMLVALVFGAFTGLVKRWTAGYDDRVVEASGDVAWALLAPRREGARDQ